MEITHVKGKGNDPLLKGKVNVTPSVYPKGKGNTFAKG
jgi:hypothetical protein